jgi:hypothetical protein
MAKDEIGSVQLVLVTKDGSTQLWVAAVARADAVRAVKVAVADPCNAELTNQHLTPAIVSRLYLAPGEVKPFASLR